jgi:hypothetical protein
MSTFYRVNRLLLSVAPLPMTYDHVRRLSDAEGSSDDEDDYDSFASAMSLVLVVDDRKENLDVSGEEVELKENCVICMDTMTSHESMALDCCHVFHMDCIREWFQNGHNTCPSCRSRVRLGNV